MNIKLTMYSADLSSELSLPFADQGVRAGFPSPAQDYMTDSIDLNRDSYVIRPQHSMPVLPEIQ